MAINANMKVDTSVVESASKTISEQGHLIEASYKSVFGYLRTIDTAWDGDDNSEYNEKFKSFEKDFLELTTFIEKMVNHLELTSKAYKTVESATTKTAKKLSL